MDRQHVVSEHPIYLLQHQLGYKEVAHARQFRRLWEDNTHLNKVGPNGIQRVKELQANKWGPAGRSNPPQDEGGGKINAHHLESRHDR